jgi:ABC-2 type transport system permease protein
VALPDAVRDAGPTTAAPAPSAGRFGEIYDRGYKHYEGPRLGRAQALWALVRYSMKRALGIKKGVGAKIIPILLYVGVILPVVIDIGVRAAVERFGANLEGASVFPSYDDFFAFIFILEGIFVATVAPEMLCGDRQENVLALYFSRAITRADYLLAKLTATAILTMTVSLLPAVVLWLGRQLLEDSPLQAMRDNLDDLGRIVVAGITIAFFLGAGGLLISSFTGRKSIAVAIIILGYLITEALANALLFGSDIDEEIARFFVFLSPFLTAGRFVGGLFDAATDPAAETANLSVWVYAAVMGGIVLVACAVMYWRYVPDE